MGSMKRCLGACALFFVIAGCASIQARPPVNRDSVNPGGIVFRGDKRFKLLGTPISVGNSLPSVKLVNAMTMEEVDLSQEKGRILYLSIVPSIDTRVCEAQTHYLGEEGDRLPQGVQRITYKEGEFGRSTGLLMDGYKLLARSVILVDKHGIVRYIQVVPEMTHLPDMEAAFRKAIQLLQEG